MTSNFKVPNVQVCLYKLRSSLSGICIFLSLVTLSVLVPNIFTNFCNTYTLYCLISEGKVTDEAGVGLTLQNCTRDITGFDVRRVNAHSKGLTTFLITKAKKMHNFSNVCDKVLYMFRTEDLSETYRVLYRINLRNWLLL